MKCEDCKFWSVELLAKWGYCKRFPPRASDGETDSEWPDTDYNDWCGEFQQKETE